MKRQAKTYPLASVATLLAALAAFSMAHARAVIGVALALGLVCSIYAVTHFEISTDLDALLDPQLPWRANAQEIERSFPAQRDDIVVVIDGATPERAEAAASALTVMLRRNTVQFAAVERVNGGRYFDQYGMLYQSREQVRQNMAAMIAAQPMLAAAAQDPSLRGLLSSLTLSASASELNPDAQIRIARAANEIAAVIEARRRSQPAFLSWRELLSGQSERPDEWRQFISIIPKLDYTSSAPAARASQAVRQCIYALGLDRDHGVAVRISGSAPIADEELATLTESSGPVALLMITCMIGVLYWATGSARAVTAALFTIATGAAITSAFGLLIFGRFNLVSIAFLPLFFGLGIDFCVQLLARYSAQETGDEASMTKAVRHAGAGLALAAGAIAAAFFSFLPTAYRGVAELGVVAGFGMMIAFLLCMTLLPALLKLWSAHLKRENGFAWFAPAERTLIKRRRAVLLTTVAVAFACLWVLPGISFDFDPMHLRDPQSEAVSVYYEMTRSLDTTPNIINLTAPTLASAQVLAARLQRTPHVGQVLTLASLIPDDQDAKLALIGDARTLLDFSLNPFDVAPPPDDAMLKTALHAAVTSLRTLGSSAMARAGFSRLAGELETLARNSPAARTETANALMQDLPLALSQLRAALQAQPITLATLPPDLRRAWLAPSGLARVQIAPAAPVLTPAQNQAFVASVRRVAPGATGDAVTIVESGATIVSAFAAAGTISALAIALLLGVALRGWRWVTAALAPVLFAGFATFALCSLSGLAINLENMIALPLLLGIGVAFNIYLVTAWRAGERRLIASSLGRGVFFSTATTGLSFASLLLSAHPGTASMGALLLIALISIALSSFIVTPALLAFLTPASEERV